MKKKLLVLSASAVLASHFLIGGEASAIVSGEKNPYTSKALSIMERSNTSSVTTEQYKKSLEDLIYKLTISGYEKYDEPEYEAVVKKYQQRFMAEMEAMNQFLQGEKVKERKRQKNEDIPEHVIGLTHQRYEAIYNALKENKSDFDREIAELNEKHPELKTFDSKQQSEADQKLNDLENQVLMLGKTFIKKDEARASLYQKLDLSIGYTDNERKEKKAINQRMLDRKVEDLETIIDEFFEEADLARPKEIPVLTRENENDSAVKAKLRKDAQDAKNDASLRHPRALKQQSIDAPSQPSHQEVAQPSVNSIEIKAPQTATPQQPVHTETIVHTPMTAVPQTKHETTFDVPQGRNTQTSATANSEQATETVDVPKANGQVQSEQVATPGVQQTHSMAQQSETPQPVAEETEIITENHVVDIDESTTFQKSGYLYGVSESDTSGYTEREKRAIRRNHVREAEALVNQYVETHRYQDRIAAQQKVNTLSKAHQKRFNKMINKAYNGQ
ncbi:coagulase [Staphylococcus pseudintermedius]|uniref:coagulase domain-containing protein n=1 Tax=Staphylococcus pseudintermedius TaxID=283734 RepID=UPI001A098F70|nr:coagulase domain-containing protein [Staphylococcus pseudintermedius]EGQ1690272.1 coagulase [Staphylococcus pseudintermedius]EGQ2810745.1 coagulase [Staphylococcus pseudintermedius]EGQ2812050.1 coagulase [Staphylococcus pseudintermedius]EGQ2833066.1 coagulase [Staphylococcus pseudintermedius]EGQ2833487.1 coagulase [Staphylococcus pseudintermedius]